MIKKNKREFIYYPYLKDIPKPYLGYFQIMLLNGQTILQAPHSRQFSYETIIFPSTKEYTFAGQTMIHGDL